ncbi:hypothetical protein LZ30DRAFT_408503 [Colletotrichum cereale]|nr:hypothetical protein LZ30DRAFT_408503 [Colletotrichum cereale]
MSEIRGQLASNRVFTGNESIAPCGKHTQDSEIHGPHPPPTGRWMIQRPESQSRLSCCTLTRIGDRDTRKNKRPISAENIRPKSQTQIQGPDCLTLPYLGRPARQVTTLAQLSTKAQAIRLSRPEIHNIHDPCHRVVLTSFSTHRSGPVYLLSTSCPHLVCSFSITRTRAHTHIHTHHRSHRRLCEVPVPPESVTTIIIIAAAAAAHPTLFRYHLLVAVLPKYLQYRGIPR